MDAGDAKDAGEEDRKMAQGGGTQGVQGVINEGAPQQHGTRTQRRNEGQQRRATTRSSDSQRHATGSNTKPQARNNTRTPIRMDAGDAKVAGENMAQGSDTQDRQDTDTPKGAPQVTIKKKRRYATCLARNAMTCTQAYAPTRSRTQRCNYAQQKYTHNTQRNVAKRNTLQPTRNNT
jgi:hypothetical protein